MKRRMTSLTLAASVGVIVVLGALVSSLKLLSHNPSLPAQLSRSAAGDGAALGRLAEVPASTTQQILTAYGKLPLSFEANCGQSERPVKFLARGSGYTMFLTATEAVLALKDEGGTPPRELPTDRSSFRLQSSSLNAVRMKLLGANPAPQVAGVDELPGKVNYFIGRDPQQWHTDFPTYAKVKYQDVYPGVDLIYYGNQRQLEYDFVIAAGADPKAIKFEFEDLGHPPRQTPHCIEASGDLVLETAGGEIRWHKPFVYQEVDGLKQTIPGSFVLIESLAPGPRVGFQIGEYDVTKPLVIDPILVYSTYLGGSDTDRGLAPAVDQNGNVYVTGETRSPNFPMTNPLQPAPGGGLDAFVTKLNASGSAVIYSTYLGGSGNESSLGIAVDEAGNAYVSGRTTSTNFPTANPLQPAYGGGATDAFVAKLNPAGSALVYSTYLGGNSNDAGFDLRLDAVGSAYVSGRTSSINFPTANPLQPANAGGFDAFVAKLNPAGSALVYSTYLGGSGNEGQAALAVDGGGNAYAAANTASTDFPIVNSLQATYGGGPNDAFVAKLNPAGSALIYSTYLGSSGDDVAFAVAADHLGNAYVVGRTSSTNFLTVNPLQPAKAGGDDAFVAKLNPAGSALIYSTYLGGSNDDNIFGIAADAAGNAYVSGWTSSLDFPVANPLQSAYGGGITDAFAAKLNATGSMLVYSTYLGGSGEERGDYIVLDAADNAYLTGWTASLNFPTRNPLQSAYGGGAFDAFVVKLSADARSTTIASVSAASFSGSAVASESIVSAFGSGMVGTTLAASTTPLPTSLAGTSVKLKDSSGTERLAPLLFVSPTQINFQIPVGTIVGTATVTVTNNQAQVAVGTAPITRVAPGIFTANSNGQGVAAAVVMRVKAGNVQSYEPVAAFDPAQNQFVTLPIDLGPETDQVFLMLFGTGIRFRSSLSAVTAKLGDADGQMIFAGAQGEFAGLDQVNVRMPRSLIGRGEVEVLLTVEAQMANPVRIHIQ